MKHRLLTATAALLATAPLFAAEPDYRSIRMQIDVNKPVAEVWARVGKYCDISEWMGFECKITSGDGNVGTVRTLANGAIKEIMIAKGDYSYGYSQPVVEGKYYDQYHGFLEAKAVAPMQSTLVYTLMVDESQQANAAAKDADLARRKATFTKALETMKALAEGKPVPPATAPARPAAPAATPGAPARPAAPTR